MRLAPVRCRICCYTLFYLLMMPVARLVCQRPLSNFRYFRTPLAHASVKFLFIFFLRPPYSPALVNGGSLFDCLLTVFDDSYTVPIVKNTQHHFVYQSSQVYQDCTNSVPTVHQSLKTVKNSQKTVKTAKMTIGVPFSFLLFWLSLLNLNHLTP